MSWFALLLVCLAWADPDPAALAAQRLAAERAAAQVARARAEGARRAELAELMAVYRAEAESLAALEAAQSPGLDAQVRTRREAITALSDAVAAGGQASEALSLLEAWIGDPAARLSTLDAALAAIVQVRDPVLRRDLLLDVLDQCDGLALLATWRALEAEALADRLELRALALQRRDAPGQAESIEVTVAALRLREQALVAEQGETHWMGWRDGALALRERADGLLREEP